MSLSMITAAALQAAEETHTEAAVNPWIVGAVALGILMAMLLALIAFGGGREHS